MKTVTILLASHNRPIYLWACLDSLYRTTTSPYRLVLIDVASTDPLVAEVIDGFVRRGMIDEVIVAPDNDPGFVPAYAMRHLDSLSPYFVYLESDVVIGDREGCWLEHMAGLMDTNPRLGLLGAAIDGRDFISDTRAEALREGRTDEELAQIIKRRSSERKQAALSPGDEPLIRPHTPAGRFLMLRPEVLRAVGIARDDILAKNAAAAGFDVAIAAHVRHRHLSLLHLYDQPRYNLAARGRHVAAYMPGGTVAS